MNSKNHDPSILKAHKDLEQLLVKLLLKQPFYAHIITGLSRSFTREIATMGVAISGGSPILLINPDFLFTQLQSEDHRIGALIHEIIHLVFRHPLRYPVGENHYMWNSACDIVVNRLIPESLVNPYFLSKKNFPLAEIPDNSSAEGVYAALKTSYGDDDPGAACTFDFSGHRGWRKLDEQEEIGHRALLNRMLAKAWNKTNPDSQQKLPAAISSIINELSRKQDTSMDWNRLLRIFGASCGSGKIKTTLHRRSRRYGTYPGTRVSTKRRLAVAIDTSASISDRQLGLFYQEIDAMHRSGAEITIIECDTDLRRIFQYRNGPPPVISGRGGTAFEPVLDWMAERKGQFNGLVYLTDGMGPYPRNSPGCRMLWVLNPDPLFKPCELKELPFGPSIHLDPVDIFLEDKND